MSPDSWPAGLLASTSNASSDNPQNQANPTPSFQPYGPDLNGDGVVNFTDLSMMLTVLNGWNAPSAWVQAADVNGDGVIDFHDLNAVLMHFGQAITPPPPPPPPPRRPPDPTPPHSNGNDDPGTQPGSNPQTSNRLLPGDGFTA